MLDVSEPLKILPRRLERIRRIRAVNRLVGKVKEQRLFTENNILLVQKLLVIKLGGEGKGTAAVDRE